MTDAPTVPTLIVQGGPIDGATMELSEGSSTIVGSGRLAHLRVDHPDIELAHVKVTWDIYGISMVDNGSRHGTWVNGEPVETAALLDGDVISFVAPGSPAGVPAVRIAIPEGSVAPPPPPEPGQEAPPAEAPPAEAPAPEVAPAPAPPAPRRAPTRARRGRAPGLGLPLKGIALVVAGLGLLGGAGWFAMGFLASKPELASVAPGQSPPGQPVTLNGRDFHPEAARNKVWFGDRPVPASTVSEGTLRVSVPSLPAPGPVRVSVETPKGRSNAVAFVLLPPLAVTALEPPGALPGDEVVLRGQGLGDEALTVTVGGQPATVVESADDFVRFTMPAVEGERGSAHSVVATLNGRSTASLDLALGRLPLLVSFDPPQAVAGEVVRIRGLGFSRRPSANAVTFDGVPSLVARASAEELTVFAPIPVPAQPRTLAKVLVSADGRRSDAATYPLRRLLSGSYVLRFFPATAGEGGAPGQAVVASEIAPALLLTHNSDDGSVAVRALRVSKLLNDVVERARKGEDVTFAALREPSIGLGTTGGGELIVEVTAQDAAAYAAAPGVPPRGAPPAPMALADYWAALLNDYLVVCTGRGRPSHVAALSPQSGRPFDQLRSAMPWQDGQGVGNERVARLPGRLRQQLRAAALQAP
jgi:hypothetical protein